jgi:replicative DNA helicase
MPNRQPIPVNLLAEQRVLGALLDGKGRDAGATGRLSPDHFADPLHAELFQHVISIACDRSNVGPLDLSGVGACVPSLADIGGTSYLDQIRAAASNVTVGEFEASARIIRDAWARRQLIDLGGWLRLFGEHVATAAFRSAAGSAAEQAAYARDQIHDVAARIAELSAVVAS